jgi:hypothetical protein
MNKDFRNVFINIIGKPCWAVKPGHGTSLTMEFGKPRIEIREPRTPQGPVSKKLRETFFERRHVQIIGEWHLWICWSDWTLYKKGKRVGDSSTRRSMEPAVNFLDGQKLIRFSISPRRVQSIFVFDLGATLKVTQSDESSDQWMIFGPAKKVLALRADGRYSYDRSDRPVDEKKWKPI